MGDPVVAENRIDILVSLGSSFYRSGFLASCFDRLARLGNVILVNDAEEFDRELPRASAWLGWGWPRPTPESLKNAANLRWSGHLNLTRDAALALIDRGVAVSEARRCWSPAVAEMALALMLSGLRRISEQHEAMRRGGETWPFDDFPAKLDPRERELTGRPVGIIGFGGIGRRLAELLRPFRVALRVYDPYASPDEVQSCGATPAALADLVESCDVVVLCAADTAQSRHLLGRAEIEALRPDAVLVNVGRASLIDTKALIERLGRGDLIAMLDVFDCEPLEQDSPLRNLPNAHLTPHRAGGLVRSVQRGIEMLTDDLQLFLENKPMRHKIDRQTAKTALTS